MRLGPCSACDVTSTSVVLDQGHQGCLFRII
jgi:hypothetical protein